MAYFNIILYANAAWEGTFANKTELDTLEYVLVNKMDAIWIYA